MLWAPRSCITALCVCSEDDPFWCPWNPSTGAMYERTITYDFTCNFSMPLGQGTVLARTAHSLARNSAHVALLTSMCKDAVSTFNDVPILLLQSLFLELQKTRRTLARTRSF